MTPNRYLQRRSDEDISLESYVYHLLYYVPLPPPSRSVKLTYFGESITCPRPKPSELPLFDYFMSDLFRLLDLDSFLQLFTCVLLENQVLLYSKGKFTLHNNIMSIFGCVVISWRNAGLCSKFSYISSLPPYFPPFSYYHHRLCGFLPNPVFSPLFSASLSTIYYLFKFNFQLRAHAPKLPVSLYIMFAFSRAVPANGCCGMCDNPAVPLCLATCVRSHIALNSSSFP